MTTYKYNSADNHIDQRWIPANLWQDRVAQKFRADAPRVVEKDGTWVWEWEGRVFGGRDGELRTAQTTDVYLSNIMGIMRLIYLMDLCPQLTRKLY